MANSPIFSRVGNSLFRSKSLSLKSMSESLFKKSDMSDSLVFWERIALLLFHSPKTSDLLEQICCFHHVFHCFSPFYPLYAQEQIAPVALHPIALFQRANSSRRSLKKTNKSDSLFQKRESQFWSFPHKKPAICSKNQRAISQSWFSLTTLNNERGWGYRVRISKRKRQISLALFGCFPLV